jgi:uncharacterized damage-inducible protein DinB
MSKLALIRALYEYNEWANGHILDTASQLTEDELDHKLGASFDSVRGNLAHTVGGQIVWLSRWTGERSDAFELIRGEAPMARLRQAFDASHADLRRFIEALAEDTLERDLPYKDSQREQQQATLWKLMVQLANHGTHHRAETALLMTTIGKPPRQLDYLFFEIERAGSARRLT